MSKTKFSKFVKSLKASHAAIAKERDKLRETIEEMEALEFDCEAAMENIDQAIELLSELQ